MGNIKIPEEFKKDCEPDHTKFGKFLKQYYLRKRIKKSKIQEIINKNETYFPSMTKLHFLEHYLLNNDYTLDDFLSVNSPSLRGFIFESIWDICIKCNVVPGIDTSVVFHMDGKIENLAIIDHELNASSIEKKLINYANSLSIIKNIYKYFKKSKVQSGNTGGVSDITAKYKDVNDSYVLISSKFYQNEKDINNYDIAELQYVMKNTNTTFKIVLLVNNKSALLQKMKRTHKHHTRESMNWILDTTSLHIYLNRLREHFRYLDSINITKKEYLSQNDWKPILDLKFHNILFYNSFIHKTHKLWNSNLIHSLSVSILYTIQRSNNNKIHIITSNSLVKSTIEKLAQKHFGFENTTILFSDFSKSAFKKNAFDLRFIIGTLTELKSVNTNNDDVLICTDILDVSKSADCLSWNLEDSCYPDPINKNISKYLIEQTLSNLYGIDQIKDINLPFIPKQILANLKDSYRSNQFHFIDYKIVSKTEKSTLEDNLMNTLLGFENSYREDFVIINKLKKLKVQFFNIILLIHKTVSKSALKKIISDNQVFFKQRLNNIKLEVSYFNRFKLSEDFVPDVVVVDDNEISFENVYNLIGVLYEKVPSLVLVDNNINRINLFKQLFIHSSISRSASVNPLHTRAPAI